MFDSPSRYFFGTGFAANSSDMKPQHALFLAVFFSVWTVIDLPFFVAGKLFGIGPDKRFREV